MGTCFTKTEHVTGRQRGYRHQRRHSEHPPLGTVQNHYERSTCQTEKMSGKFYDDSIHRCRSAHGGRSIQTRYNKWIAGKQARFCQYSDKTGSDISEVNTGKQNTWN